MLDANSSSPLYVQLADYYRQRILSGTIVPGDRLASEPEIAEQLGVSRGTVRRAMDILVEEGRLVSVRGKGTFAVSLPVENCARLIGLVMPFLSDALGAEILKGAESVLRQNGYSLIYGSSEGELAVEREQIQRLELNRVCGMILMPAGKYEEALMISRTLTENTPLVVIDRAIPGYPAPSVYVDNRGGARMAVEHLLALGHRRIGCITHKGRISSVQERVRGYEQAMRAVDLLPLASVYLEWHGPSSDGLSPDYSDEEMRPIEQMLQSPERPTALFCVNDFTAAGVMQYILRRGLKIPQDMAIIGFDDIPLAPYMSVPLSSLAQPRFDVGQQAGALLIKLISGEPVQDECIVLPTRLVVRGSTDPTIDGRWPKNEFAKEQE